MWCVKLHSNFDNEPDNFYRIRYAEMLTCKTAQKLHEIVRFSAQAHMWSGCSGNTDLATSQVARGAQQTCRNHLDKRRQKDV